MLYGTLYRGHASYYLLFSRLVVDFDECEDFRLPYRLSNADG